MSETPGGPRFSAPEFGQHTEEILLEQGYDVFPVANAISSRDPDNRTLGLERMRQSGAVLISTEMLVFELLRDARDPHFKTLQSLIK